MKKGVVVLLVVLAAVVLISPALVGRLAEQSMDENLNWAASESGDLKVTSEYFTRGWFSSEGQHRVEFQEGDLLGALQAMAGPLPADELPVLIINTRLDHGLIPVSSIAREQGSLSPGLGSAVSTLQIELPGGQMVEIPGAIYSKIAIGGKLHSNYVVEGGSRSLDDVTGSWGNVDVDVTTDPANGEVLFEGSLSDLAFAAGDQAISLEKLRFEGRQQPTRFGFAVGDVSLAMDGLLVNEGGNQAGMLSTMQVEGKTSIDDGDLSIGATVEMSIQNLPQFGDMSVEFAVSLAGADAEALGRVQQELESAAGSPDPMAVYASAEDDIKLLFASGFEFAFERLDVTLPQGTISSKMRFVFDEEDPATFDWTSLLLATEASIDVSVPVELVEIVAQDNPQAALIIGGGYLVKRGDAYEMEARLKKGLLTVNGAPIPIPLNFN